MSLPNQKTQTLECKQGAVRAVRFNVDGNYCMTCGSDKTIKLWNPLRGLYLKTYTGHGYEVLDAQSSSDNSHICSGGMDKTVALFDVSTGQAIRKYRDHAGQAIRKYRDYADRFAWPQGQAIRKYRDYAGTGRFVWSQGQAIRKYRDHAGRFAWSQGLAIRKYRDHAGRFAWSQGQATRKYRDYAGRFAWPQGQAIRKYRDYAGRFAWSQDQAIMKYRDYAGTVNCVCFNEESTVILSGSIDCTVRVWDVRSRKSQPIQELGEAKDSVTTVQVSDHEILTGSADSRVRRYDLRIGRVFSDFVGKAVSCAKFTRDGQCVLVSSVNASLKLLDKDSGELLNEYSGHKNSNYKIDCCLNHKDTHILSGSEDGSVYIWDLLEAKVCDKLEHKTSKTVHSLSFHPSEPVLVTACADKVFVWESNQPDQT
ncbi:hypothetical protein PoB_000358700 [Plakobranchus ocellatus]|uniref:WD repeat domain-containing protein 83 n=1 Tax=Plakobranchus ocellatus TaxID=259542 RepID=A0AAV3Y3Q9_9GAST|nr:hypothetical protein PoB_000358700 [Plakobranchus ocellatus]